MLQSLKKEFKEFSISTDCISIAALKNYSLSVKVGATNKYKIFYLGKLLVSLAFHGRLNKSLQEQF